MTTGLEVRGLRAGYGRVEVLHRVDLTLPLGTMVALVGANGAGKSTLLRVLAGLVRVRAGEMVDDGVPVGRGPAHRRAARGVTLVPDEHNVFPSLTVAENLHLFGAGGPVDPALEVFPELSRQVDAVGSDRLRARTVKVFVYGVVEGGTATVLAP